MILFTHIVYRCCAILYKSKNFGKPNRKLLPNGGLVMLKAVLLITVILMPSFVLGQSTSAPILIQPEANECTPSAGSCYLDVTFMGGSLYQHANWYTNFIGRNTRQGNLTITINSQLETGTVSDTKASNPVTLTKNGNDVSFSYQGPIASLLPLTFS